MLALIMTHFSPDFLVNVAWDAGTPFSSLFHPLHLFFFCSPSVLINIICSCGHDWRRYGSLCARPRRQYPLSFLYSLIILLLFFYSSFTLLLLFFYYPLLFFYYSFTILLLLFYSSLILLLLFLYYSFTILLLLFYSSFIILLFLFTLLLLCFYSSFTPLLLFSYSLISPMSRGCSRRNRRLRDPHHPWAPSLLPILSVLLCGFLTRFLTFWRARREHRESLGSGNDPSSG